MRKDRGEFADPYASLLPGPSDIADPGAYLEQPPWAGDAAGPGGFTASLTRARTWNLAQHLEQHLRADEACRG